MNIQKIRKRLEETKGQVLNFRFNGSRNQIEEFCGVVKQTYNYIFIIKIDEHDLIRSFSYSDILTNQLEIY